MTRSSLIGKKKLQASFNLGETLEKAFTSSIRETKRRRFPSRRGAIKPPHSTLHCDGNVFVQTVSEKYTVTPKQHFVIVTKGSGGLSGAPPVLFETSLTNGLHFSASSHKHALRSNVVVRTDQRFRSRGLSLPFISSPCSFPTPILARTCSMRSDNIFLLTHTESSQNPHAALECQHQWNNCGKTNGHSAVDPPWAACLPQTTALPQPDPSAHTTNRALPFSTMGIYVQQAKCPTRGKRLHVLSPRPPSRKTTPFYSGDIVAILGLSDPHVFRTAARVRHR